MIKLFDFQKQDTDDGVRLSCDMSIDGSTQVLTFNISAPEHLCADITPDPSAFVIAMLMPAMERGEDLFVDAPLDATLLHKLNANVVRFLKHFDPNLTRISVSSATTVETAPMPIRGAVTGMSSGVDSLDTLERFSQDNTPDRYKVKALAVFDVGAFEDTTPEFSQARCKITVNKAKRVAEKTGTDLFVVDSNLADFYQTRFVDSVGMRNIACAYTLADLFDTYLGASSVSYKSISMVFSDRNTLDKVDQLLFPTLASPRMESILSSAGIGRFEKMLFLFDHSPFVEQIELCMRPNHKKLSNKNCGTCIKCAKFLLVAECHGSLDRFHDAFEVDEYERRKWRVCQRVVAEANTGRIHTSGIDVLAYLEERKFKMPFGAEAAGKLTAYLTPNRKR